MTFGKDNEPVRTQPASSNRKPGLFKCDGCPCFTNTQEVSECNFYFKTEYNKETHETFSHECELVKIVLVDREIINKREDV
jgi:hypothetical protein